MYLIILQERHQTHEESNAHRQRAQHAHRTRAREPHGRPRLWRRAHDAQDRMTWKILVHHFTSASSSKRGTMEAKQYAAVLTGAMRRLTEEDTTITAERIKQEVFPDASLEGAPALISSSSPAHLCRRHEAIRADHEAAPTGCEG